MKFINAFKLFYKKHFEKEKLNLLSPIVLNKEDGINNYIKTLKNAIKDKDAKNIAISGSYGSGKSSVIKTYINENDKHRKKTLIISTSSFINKIDNNNRNIELVFKKDDTETIKIAEQEQENDNSNGDSIEKKDRYLNQKEEILLEKIEKSIIRQLVYRISYTNSKFSNIRRPQKFWKIKYILLSFAIFNILSFFICITENNIKNYIFNNHLYIPVLVNNTIIQYTFYVIYILSFVVIIFLFLYNTLTLLTKTKMKINYNGTQVEIEKNKNDNKERFSFLDNLYEIIYFFINTKYNTIIFEDIDRYGEDICIKTIEDLKELNSILNECSELKRRKITFIYSLKDSIFETPTEKAKMYDYIISVMPISSTSNSYINFINEINKYDKTHTNINIDNDLLKLVSKYIQDMRLIKNIINEFVLHRKVLDSKDDNKLFSMVVFKNIYLKEYDHLFDLSKENLIDKKIEEKNHKIDDLYDKKINDINEKLNKYRNSNIKSIKELKQLLVYNNSVNGCIPNSLYIDGKYYSIDSFYDDNFDINLLGNNNAYFNINGGNYTISYGDFQNLKQFKEKIDNINVNLKELETEKNKLISEKFSEEDPKEKAREIIEKNKDKELIDELIYKDYIDKNYLDYITSVSNDKDITANDSRFINSLNHKKSNFDLDLKIVPDYLEIIDSDFDGVYILNVSLIKYLIEENDESRLNRIIAQFKNIESTHIEFLNYIRITENDLYLKFIKLLAINFEYIWNSYNEKNNKELDVTIDNEIWIDFFNIKNINTNELKNKEKLKDIIETYGNIFNIDFENNDIVKKNILFMEIRFNNIYNVLNTDKINTKSLAWNTYFSINYNHNFEIGRIEEYIIRNNLYKINELNIKYIIREDKVNMSLIYKSKYSKNIIGFMKKNIKESADNLYIGKDDKINIDKVIEFIYKESDYETLIREVIKKEDYINSSIKLDKKYLEDLYNNKKIRLNWDLVSFYAKGITEEDNLIFKIVKENIELLISSNDLYNIKNVNKVFINRLINYYNKICEYSVVNIILKNYDSKKVKKIVRLKNNVSPEKLEIYVKYNLVNFNTSNYKIIKEKDELLNIYIRNWCHDAGVKSIYNILDSNTFTRYKNIFSIEDKVYILNKWIKSEKYSRSKIDRIILDIFNYHKNYKVSYKNDYLKNIFGKSKVINYETKKDKNKIIFYISN